MRAAYLDDLRSKFLLENNVLKMEYAEVRVLHLSHKVWTVRVPALGPHPADPPFLMASPAFPFIPGLQLRPCLSGLQSQMPSGHFFLCSLERAST